MSHNPKKSHKKQQKMKIRAILQTPGIRMKRKRNENLFLINFFSHKPDHFDIYLKNGIENEKEAREE